MPNKKVRMALKPRARLMSLLGEQLIQDSRIAVFELVKNAYDADSTIVNLRLENTEGEKEDARIIVKDNGSGMDWKTVTGVWLEPGTDYRKAQRDSGWRTPIHDRVPLGEKGIGRFAAHKLGEKITLVTRKKNSMEIKVFIDWTKFDTAEYLDDVGIDVIERSPKIFKGNKTGTKITIRGIKEKWTRRDIRSLHRAVNSICSPYDIPSKFQTKLVVKPDFGYLDDLMSTDEVLKTAPFIAEVEINNDYIIYHYQFKPSQKMSLVKGRKISNKIPIILPEEALGKNLDDLGIGPIKMNLHMFDMDTRITRLITADVSGLRMFLRENGGIRVYRNGIRVYNYGEAESDWLELDRRRVNDPTTSISNRIVIGAVSLDSSKSKKLVEKTNREGFIESRAYYVFRYAILAGLKHVEAERKKDKRRLRIAYGKSSDDTVITELENLKQALDDRGILEELKPIIDEIEDRYEETLQRLLLSAGTGLSLFVMVHEFERMIHLLGKTGRRSPEDLKNAVDDLYELLRGIIYLARRGKRTKQKMSTLVNRALSLYRNRFRHHQINIINTIGDENNPDFSVSCNRAQMIIVLTNLIDNAIYWLNVKSPTRKKISIRTTKDLYGKHALLISDNGTGFLDSPDELLQPFFTRKPDGSGLGLYIIDEIMKMHKGEIVFPDKSEICLPKGVNKAIVGLVFGEIR